ncbi:MAG: serpin family protein [Verrucomicrobia bacterium]|nr:serpin family protein [Verrucomicrobiota bacterium]
MTLFRRLLAGLVAMIPSLTPAQTAPPPTPSPEAEAINALGLDLLGRLEPGNALLSPYSIQCALAMTYAGADGATREEMRRVLHYPTSEAALHEALGRLNAALQEIARASVQRAEAAKKYGGPREPIAFQLANRLFGEKTYTFKADYLELVRSKYAAPLQAMDFRGAADQACREINAWVEAQTNQRIKNLLPSLSADARLVLVNAVYLKAPWAKEFSTYSTAPRPFHVNGGAAQDRPTMLRQANFGYRKLSNCAAVTVPYAGEELQFLALVPDQVDGLAEVERSLNAALLAECAAAPATDVILELPKFRLEPDRLALADALGGLGMKTAFDQPKGSADFSRMAPRTPADYLFISAIFHKTFLALDERGTEAAAATAVVMAAGSAAPRPKPKPIELKIDRPFLFAIQHRASGSCLFLGRVTDPK